MEMIYITKKLYSEEYVQDIANAIKNGNNTPDAKYKISEMANAIIDLVNSKNVTIDLYSTIISDAKRLLVNKLLNKDITNVSIFDDINVLINKIDDIVVSGFTKPDFENYVDVTKSIYDTKDIFNVNNNNANSNKISYNVTTNTIRCDSVNEFIFLVNFINTPYFDVTFDVKSSINNRYAVGLLRDGMKVYNHPQQFSIVQDVKNPTFNINNDNETSHILKLDISSTFDVNGSNTVRFVCNKGNTIVYSNGNEIYNSSTNSVSYNCIPCLSIHKWGGGYIEVSNIKVKGLR